MINKPIITRPVRKIKALANGNVIAVLNAMPLAGLRTKHRHCSIDTLLAGMSRPELTAIYRNLAA